MQPFGMKQRQVERMKTLRRLTSFIKADRDEETITHWADNCSAQNKNWALYTMLTFLVNSQAIAAKTITVQYFEPGHTYMAADSVHAEIESLMRKMKKVYEFDDFTNFVKPVNCTTVQLNYHDFKRGKGTVIIR